MRMQVIQNRSEILSRRMSGGSKVKKNIFYVKVIKGEYIGLRGYTDIRVPETKKGTNLVLWTNDLKMINVTLKKNEFVDIEPRI